MILQRNFRFLTLQRQWKKCRFIFLIISFVFFPLYLILTGGFTHTNPSLSPDKVFKNYFQDIENLELIVNTSGCKIPHFSPWNSAMIPFIKEAKPLEDCIKTNYNWSSVDSNILMIHTTNMEQDGYSFHKDFCCYKSVKRVEQSEEHYDKEADNLISYSECIPILYKRTRISSEFLMIECRWSRLFGPVLYRGFHASALFPEQSSRISQIKVKISHWSQSKSNKKTEVELPPNILIIGQDSTSRINFRRNMPKTLKILEDLGSIEMNGYTKVGENTFPNFVPIMNGYSEDDLIKLCYPNRYIKQDNCPLIWKRFDTANYLTAHIEDAPIFAIFHYMKTGFVKQPVDFYSRPLWLAASDYGQSFLHSFRAEHLDCIGYLTNDEMITSYLESTLDFAKTNHAPIFSLSWSTTLSHDNLNAIQTVDETYANFLLGLRDKSHLDNTIIFFMGDHGYRFGAVRETLIGYFEDKLPNMWIRLPSRLKTKFPQWQKALEVNSRRLTSPFMLYWTFNLILETFTALKPPKDAFMLPKINQNPKEESLKSLKRQHRYNFLEQVPTHATCEDLGVPDIYCACYPLQKVDLNDTLLHTAAQIAMHWVNKEILSGSKCTFLQISKITSGAMMDKNSMHELKIDGKKTYYKVQKYIVGFLTFPGSILIEAEVYYFPSNTSFSSKSSVQRANKINVNDIKCIKDPIIELFCYCPT